MSHGLLTAARTLLRLGPAAVACVGRDLPSARVCCARRGQRLRGSPARAEPAVSGYACRPTKASTTSGRPCWRAAYCLNHLPTPACTWPRGVTVSTLDSESSDRGSNPRETCEQPLDLIAHPCPAGWLLVMAVLLWWGSCRQLQAPQHCQCWGRPEVQLRTTRLHAADLASQTAVCAWLVSWCNG